METDPKKQRQHFYRDYASGQWRRTRGQRALRQP